MRKVNAVDWYTQELWLAEWLIVIVLNWHGYLSHKRFSDTAALLEPRKRITIEEKRLLSRFGERVKFISMSSPNGIAKFAEIIYIYYLIK